MTSNNRQDYVTRSVYTTLRGLMNRVIRPYLRSNDEEVRRTGQQLENQRDRILSFGPETARRRTQRFLNGLATFSEKQTAYNRSAELYEQARADYQNAASELGLSLSLSPISTRETRPPQPPQNPFTQEELDLVKVRSREVYNTLGSKPEYQGQIPLAVLGREINNVVLGGRIPIRAMIIASLIGRRPADYGFNITGEKGRRYVNLGEMPSYAAPTQTVVATSTEGRRRGGPTPSYDDPIKEYIRINGPSEAGHVIAAMPEGTNKNTLHSALRRMSLRGELVHEGRLYKLPEAQPS